jgi:hypothetical protein
VKKTVEENPFTLEGLVVPESPSTKTSPKTGQKPARKKGERFVIITPVQAYKLSKASRVITVSVFLHLMFRGYSAGEYQKPFVLPSDTLEHAGISRHAQARALRSLVELDLISVERGGPRKPPIISLIGAKKRG